MLFKSPSNGSLGIGHVRWATHGIPNQVNAHPHSSEEVSVVHNGIIENSNELKKDLENKGYKFKSQTDTEVITFLLTDFLKDFDLINTINKTLEKLNGSFALGIIFKKYNNFVVGARRGSPLAVGYGHEENYLGSDSYALKSMTNKITYLDDGDICVLSSNKVEFYNSKNKKINKEVLTLSDDKHTAEKGDYKDYMSKEIISFHKSDSIFEVKRVLLEKKISGAPVISKSGKLIGIISETDIMKQIIDSKYFNMPMSRTTVSKYMTKNVDYISPNETIFDAAEKFLRLKRKRFPVMLSNRILGIISRVDIIAAALKIRGNFNIQ